jgi:SAM-dependent methyltransferase
MSDWTSGYVADIGYTFGYYGELNPLRAQLAFLNAGLIPPNTVTACELGFGQGLSANLHAAASSVSWYGTDFNPSQAAFAQDLAAAAQANAHLYDQAFQEFCERPDLPDFDYIGLHGIWSWISNENRAVIVDFLRRKLKVGGVLYISYNTQPGWAAMVPMRHLMTEHAEVMAAPGRGLESRIDAALEFAEKMLATNPLYAKANPHVTDRIKRMKEQNRNYLAHEYFNRDWQPMPFSEMEGWLGQAKLNYACSAHFIDHVEAINLTSEQQAFLREIPDKMFRETVRDFMVNQQFRRDYWVRGARKLSAFEQTDRIRAHRVILLTPPESVSLKVTGSLGEATMAESIYRPIIQVLSDFKVRSLGDIEAALAGSNIHLNQIMQAIMVLAGKGNIQSVQAETIDHGIKAQCDRINARLIDIARSSSDVAYLASPLTGGGVMTPRFHMLFLRARTEGMATAEQWAGYAWQLLKVQNQKIIREGKPIDSDADNLAELTQMAIAFRDTQLPILQALRITA